MTDDNLINLQKERERISRQLSGNSEEVLVTGTHFQSRAIAEGHEPELKRLNDMYSFIDSIGGKPMILAKVYSEVFDKKIYEYILPEALKTIYQNTMVDTNTKSGKESLMKMGDWWLGHAHRKTYKTTTFEPERKPGEFILNNEAYFNMWEGLAVEPKKGSWKKTRTHIYKILCNSDKEKFKYVMRWVAYAVQYPGKPAQVALILKGKKGTGKGVILQSIARLFGRHGLVIANREHLTGKYNQHLEFATYLYADEAYYPGDKEVEGVLKNLITEPTIAVEAKFRNLKICKNCLHIAMSTNSDWVIPATEDERRYFINEIDNKYAKDECSNFIRNKYFNDIWDEMQGDGIRAMLYDLLALKLNGWAPKDDVPETEELKKQIGLTLPKLKYCMLEILEEGTFPGALNFKGEYTITSKNLMSYIHNLDPSYKTVTGRGLAGFVKELGVVLTRTNKSRLYVFPALNVLREVWNRRINRHTKWNLEDEWLVETMKDIDY